MKALERLRSIALGPRSAPAPKSKWAEPRREEVVVPRQSLLLKLRGFVGVFLVINVCIGGYLIAKTTPKSSKKQRAQKKDAAESPPAAQAPPARVPHRKVTANEQRQLFQWMLDEKRKIKPANSIEKARIDDDKKVLKQFLRSTNLPQI
ncbi:uncharacterized protein LOC112342072 [Selaginella moellendorffii]|uniref:uncharacterized protein LOC112342072 n=1 Tax=Selaginella moellendorffii TaxID=88036 RepID=UPI000D1C9FDB|nr:uncharacterized protein LOC112342072 [Selaginella moellendorffii]|eukprot:XP_024519058.1 uncharacterized protein LOC112342072 [Selaginella moellendorffii]